MFKQILIILALCCPVAYAADVPASEASIKQLLEVVQAHKLVDNMMGQMDTAMKNVMQQVTQGEPVSPQTQKLYDKAQADVVAMMKEMLSWDKLEPVYLRVYQKSLNQQEVDGMVAFYKTPAGQALITKMPVIMQNTMTEMSQMMGPMVQRIQRMQQDMTAQIQAEKTKKGG